MFQARGKTCMASINGPVGDSAAKWQLLQESFWRSSEFVLVRTFRNSYWTSSFLALLQCLVSSGTKMRVTEGGRKQGLPGSECWWRINTRRKARRHSCTHEKASCTSDTIFHILHKSSQTPRIELYITSSSCLRSFIVMPLSFYI